MRIFLTILVILIIGILIFLYLRRRSRKPLYTPIYGNYGCDHYLETGVASYIFDLATHLDKAESHEKCVEPKESITLIDDLVSSISDIGSTVGSFIESADDN